ncbi:Radical SAM family enzyme, similar to coproporphyrinogen III oxidase, oxygen-independent, clustered with nucleoside-triphosphatase RdgB [hydrothermal vent metagenome]|uniref:Radical SAM family enzyme, similar to coproporphyrinogen III oxidase, oxygen-independent, clustered with nucleoside-triphosphatase RdgB n=1 Tax=hydrothermal vent metagenome TaxID=652676 RepID=A0A3B0XDY4_9ZZZZ
MSNTIPLSLYVHIPWCVKKCPYCDFNSHEKNQSFDEAGYVKALLIDMDEEFKHCQERSLSSIFFGGGTPSLFSADAIKQIIEHARSLFKFNDIEITLEANPGTFEQEKFIAYRETGVNRLSIGIQSFNASHLKTLGRIHHDQQALSAVETARKAGFKNINLDLMFGLPQQTIQQAIDDIKIACQFDVSHISHYQLTIEANTYFYKHTPTLPEIDSIWDMQTQCQNILAENNFNQYEISAYSQSDQQCQHNINYWQFSDYIGIGAGAHGKLSNINVSDNSMNITRRWKHRQPQQYIEKTISGNSLSGSQILSQQDIIFEFLLNALRLKSGSDIQNFRNNTGLEYSTLMNVVKNIDTELLFIDEKLVRTTDKGFLFLNTILEELV